MGERVESPLIHMIPYEVMRDVCDILDAGDVWEEIAGHMPDIKNIDVDGCKKYRMFGSPSWFLLRLWASKGYSIYDLYTLFAITRMMRCMALIRHLVDEEHHHLEVDAAGHNSPAVCKTATTSMMKSATNHTWRSRAVSGGEASVSSRQTAARPPSSHPHPPQPVHSASIASTSQASSSADSAIFSGLQNTPSVLYSELETATNNFSASHIVGKGGYGVVYRGEWKHTPVAVKRLHANSDRNNQYEKERLRQSLQELRTLAKYRHDNILPVYAFSLDGPEPCLVYQFMANGSLEDRLLCRRSTAPLTWQQKMNIADGSARGLHFLHSIARTPIIHGDVKTANILLDKHLEPKLGDFGLSRDGQVEQGAEEKSPLIASHIKGTLAYLPPEFITSKILSTKLDVYSFGVVLLEIASGMRAYSDSRQPHGLVEYALSLEGRGQGGRDRREAMMDKRTPVGEGLGPACFDRLLLLGLKCADKDRNARPSFKQIVDELADR